MNSVKYLANCRHGLLITRNFSTSNLNLANHKCKILVVGGGSGGTAVAAKLCYKYGAGSVVVLDPSDRHYYQPMFTLIGGGMKKLENSYKSMKEVLPSKAEWKHDKAVSFDPKSNRVETEKGDTIEYDYMIVSTGIELNYDKIPGLVDALENPKSQVVSNYSPRYVSNVFKAFESFKGGNAIFTFPASPVKCPGAPQKICYIFEHYLRKNHKRDNAKVYYNTALPVIFGVKHYADSLWLVVKNRDINVNLSTNLVEVNGNAKQATFENLTTKERTTMDFDLLHAVPPMSTPSGLRQHSGDLVNELGFVDVHKHTMQSVRYPNVFAIGDCANSPNSKTAAAVAGQCQVVYKNLVDVMEGKKPSKSYDGYASCPLVTGYNTCILAEFDYNLQPLETFPFDQSKERFSMLLAKRDFMAPLYWYGLTNGIWNGPGFIRRALNIFR